MDMEGKHMNGFPPGEGGSESFLWLAAVIVGGILTLMVGSIIAILLWKCFRKPNNVDQNWAGPSPLTYTDAPEINIFKKTDQTLSVNCLPNITELEKNQSFLNDNSTSNKLSQMNVEERDIKTKQAEAHGSTIIASASMDQLPNEPSATDESDLPPPADFLLDLPEPPPNDIVSTDVNQDPSLITASQYVQREDNSLFPLSLDKSPNLELARPDRQNETVELYLPPPPPEFL